MVKNMMEAANIEGVYARIQIIAVAKQLDQDCTMQDSLRLTFRASQDIAAIQCVSIFQLKMKESEKCPKSLVFQTHVQNRI